MIYISKCIAFCIIVKGDYRGYPNNHFAKWTSCYSRVELIVLRLEIIIQRLQMYLLTKAKGHH